MALHALLIPFMMAAIKPAKEGLLVAQLEAVAPADELTIGLQESEASTLDWIGYDEYQEHLAEFSETNQAAFTESPLQPAQASIADLPAEAPAEETETAEAGLVETESADEIQRETKTQLEPNPELAEAPEVEIPAEVREEVALIENTHDSPDLTPFILAARDWLLASILTRQEPSDSRSSAAQQQTEVSPSANSNSSANQNQENNPGDLAEKESDPTSVIDVPQDQWLLGKPLAAKGLELFPQRASFTLLTRMTAIIRNPVAVIEFDSRGVVVHATLFRSSGHSQVDTNLIDSLYGWRARGDELGVLNDDETIAIEIRLLMVK